VARLPIPGSDDDTWGDILNEFLAVSHNTDGTLQDAPSITGAVQQSLFSAKGDLMVASAADTPAALSVGSNGQVLTADSTQPTGVKWAPPSAGGTTGPQAYPLSAYGLVGASASLESFHNVDPVVSALFTRVFVPAGSAITAVGTVVSGVGTLGAGGLNGMAVYDDTGVLLASSANDDNMWLSTGWLFKTLTSSIPAQGSDRFVWAAMSCQGYTGFPDIQYMATDPAIIAGGGYLVTTRRSIFIVIGSWPASFNPATYGSDTGSELPLIVLA